MSAFFQSQLQPGPGTVTDAEVRAFAIANKAFDHIKEHHIAPTPENYAVWYHYALAQNGELVKELDMILKNKVPFTAHTNAYLYNKYVIADKNNKIIGEAASGANKLLSEVLKAVSEFGGETKSYNQDLDAYVDKISGEMQDDNLKTVVKNLISASAEIRGRGESLNTKLEESRQEIEVLRKNLEQVTTESQKDFLTGVYNRKAFDRLCDEQLAAAKTEHHEACLLMLDIDHFKQFNDKFGHLLGDEVLKIVAKALTDSVRGKDIVARYGGEEFVVVLPNTPIAGALKVAETIRTTIAARELKRRDTGETYGVITVSIGAAEYRPDSDSATSLIKRADEALYVSKRRGRNRVTKEGETHG